jgi:hypothetical protein
LGQQIELAKDELAGQGLYEGKKAEGDRRHELEQQIRIWAALLEKLSNEAIM